MRCHLDQHHIASKSLMDMGETAGENKRTCQPEIIGMKLYGSIEWKNQTEHRWSVRAAVIVVVVDCVRMVLDTATFNETHNQLQQM